MRPSATLPVLAALLAACDLPTSFPSYETRWNVVVVRDSISAGDLLPAGMRVTPQGFVIDRHVAESEVRLSEVCELCACFTGPLEPLEIRPHDWALPLPFGLTSATLERGTARVTVYNEVGFDLLDDGQGGRGFLVVDVTDRRSGERLRQAIVANPFPPGDSLQLSFDLSGLVLTQHLAARVSGFLPGTTCPLQLTPETGFRARVELEDVLASSVEIWLSDGALRLSERAIDLPAFLANRLREGEAHVTLEVELESELPEDVELVLSAAGSRDALFTGEAALYTPLVIRAAGPGAPTSLTRLYVVGLDALRGAEQLHLDTRNRFMNRRPVRLEGGESVSYQVRLRAEIPVR